MGGGEPVFLLGLLAEAFENGLELQWNRVEPRRDLSMRNIVHAYFSSVQKLRLLKEFSPHTRKGWDFCPATSRLISPECILDE